MSQPKLKCSHSSPCNCGAAVLQSLPRGAINLRCQCEEPEWRSFSSIAIPSIGYFCALCGRPHAFSVINHYWECEVCGKQYTKDYRTFTTVETYPGRIDSGKWLSWPPPYNLCRRHDVPTPIHRRRTSGIRFDPV